MILHSSSKRFRALTLLCGLAAVANCAAAYESENGVPLTITAALGAVTVGRTEVRLTGHDVMITTELRNDTLVRQPVAFYAQPPLFNAAGVGEEYFDKSFADLAVSIDGRERRIDTVRRGFFMGHDITRLLAKVGLSPLPDVEADYKKVARLPRIRGVQPDSWQGFVMHAWTDIVPPQESSVHQLRYRSLPQFSYEELGSGRIDDVVRQHCGDVSLVRERIRQAEAAAAYVLVEQHQLPLSVLAVDALTVNITQAATAPARGTPVLALACGLPGTQPGTSLHGIIKGRVQALHVLVIAVVSGNPVATN